MSADEVEKMRLFGQRSPVEMHDIKRKFVKERMEREHKKEQAILRYEAEMRNEQVQAEKQRREEEAAAFQARINALSASTERARKTRMLIEKSSRAHMLNMAKAALRENKRYETGF